MNKKPLSARIAKEIKQCVREIFFWIFTESFILKGLIQFLKAKHFTKRKGTLAIRIIWNTAVIAAFLLGLFLMVRKGGHSYIFSQSVEILILLAALALLRYQRTK